MTISACELYAEEIRGMNNNQKEAYRFLSDMTDIRQDKKYSAFIKGVAATARTASQKGDVKTLIELAQQVHDSSEKEKPRREMTDLLVDRIADMLGKRPIEVVLTIF